MQEVVDEARRLAEDGCREITLLGQNVNGYGKSFGRPGALAELLSKLDRIAGLKRVRFVTSHPKDIARELLQAVRDLPTVCEHLHMPAQSGSDRVLAAMNRKYDSRGYREPRRPRAQPRPRHRHRQRFHRRLPRRDRGRIRGDRLARPRTPLPELLRFQVFPAPGNRRSRVRRRRPPGREAAQEHGAAGDSVPRQHRGKQEVHRQGSRSACRRPRAPPRWTCPPSPAMRDERGKPRLTGRLRTNHIVLFEGPETLAGELVRVRIESATRADAGRR